MNGGSDTEQERDQTRTHTHTLHLLIQQLFVQFWGPFQGLPQSSPSLSCGHWGSSGSLLGRRVLCPGGWSILGLHPLDAEAPSRVRTRKGLRAAPAWLSAPC